MTDIEEKIVLLCSSLNDSIKKFSETVQVLIYYLEKMNKDSEHKE